MTIKIECADGVIRIFESNDYTISRVKDFHPAILAVTIYSNGKKIKKTSRKFRFFYKHFTFKSEKVQTVLKNIDEQERLAKEAKKSV